MEDLRILVFGHLIQAAFQGYAGLAFYGRRLNSKEFALLGLVVGLVVWMARGVQNILEIPFGFHIIIIFLAYIVAMKYIARITWGFAVTGAIMGYILIFFSESVALAPLLTAFNWNLEMVKADPWWYVLVETIATAPIILVSGWLYFTKFTLVDLANEKHGQHEIAE